MAPKRLGPYLIERELGSGTAAKVYLGRDMSTGLEVAVKAVRATSERYAARFVQEAYVLLRINHPNVVKAYSYGRYRGYLYYSMRRYEKSLRALQRPGPWQEPEGPILSLDIKLRVLTDVLRGLAYIHQPIHLPDRRRIFHRDLAPLNILLDDQDNACIADFGLLKIEGDPELPDSDRGNPKLYGAPEQDMGLRYAESPADVFSFAYVAYQFISGFLPKGTGFGELHDLDSEVPEDISHLIQQALQYNHESRPSAEELLAAFERHISPS